MDINGIKWYSSRELFDAHAGTYDLETTALSWKEAQSTSKCVAAWGFCIFRLMPSAHTNWLTRILITHIATIKFLLYLYSNGCQPLAPYLIAFNCRFFLLHHTVSHMLQSTSRNMQLTPSDMSIPGSLKPVSPPLGTHHTRSDPTVNGLTEGKLYRKP